MKAVGTFEVSAKFEPPYDNAHGISLARGHFDKQFSGGLRGSSQVEMLGARTQVEGSAGYVALERVQGTLGERSGTFVLQHSATMHDGKSSSSVTVVPNSGTGELRGLQGDMSIELVSGVHRYAFEYELPASPSEH